MESPSNEGKVRLEVDKNFFTNTNEWNRIKVFACPSPRRESNIKTIRGKELHF